MNFALLGVGYISPRHLQAIQETGNELVAACDPHDSVGILDKYFPNTSFFTEVERFDRHLEKLRRDGQGIDYLVVCTPNYLHDAHIRLGLRLQANVICEKPTVIKPHNIDALQMMEIEQDKKVYSILQLRLHPEIQELKKKFGTWDGQRAFVDVSYVTPRGKWYTYSWKGDHKKSGGLAMNIGIHLFDALLWIFGPVQSLGIWSTGADNVRGMLTLEKADVAFYLSTSGKKKREMIVNGQPIDFTEGLESLHTESYRQILAGNGFGLEEVRPAIELIRRMYV